MQLKSLKTGSGISKEKHRGKERKEGEKAIRRAKY